VDFGKRNHHYSALRVSALRRKGKLAPVLCRGRDAILHQAANPRHRRTAPLGSRLIMATADWTAGMPRPVRIDRYAEKCRKSSSGPFQGRCSTPVPRVQGQVEQLGACSSQRRAGRLTRAFCLMPDFWRAALRSERYPPVRKRESVTARSRRPRRPGPAEERARPGSRIRCRRMLIWGRPERPRCRSAA
jgi:hypothetical protein